MSESEAPVIVIAGPTASGKSHLALAVAREFNGAIINAGESCSAGRWRDLALAEIALARSARRLPMIVGGTGLYLSALLDGLAEVPHVPARIITETRELHARLGGGKFRTALAEPDPEIAKRLHAGDTQRL